MGSTGTSYKLLGPILACALLFSACGGEDEGKQQGGPGPDSLKADSSEVRTDKRSSFPYGMTTVFFSGGIAEGEYLHLELPEMAASDRINRQLDSVAESIVGYPLAPYIENPGSKDSVAVSMKGEIILTFNQPTYHGGLVSCAFLVKRFGQKDGDTYYCITFDVNTGRRVTLQELVQGGPPAMLVAIRQHLAAEDKKSRYDCALAPTWNEVEEFHVTREGLGWEIDARAFADRQFCKEGVHLVMPWAEIAPMMNQGSSIVDRLLKSGK